MAKSKMGSWLTVNRKCNLRCGWCYAQDQSIDQQDMPLSLATQIIAFQQEIGVEQVIIIGGEPTIYPYLFEVIDLYTSKKIKPILVTNGKKLSDSEFAKKLVAAGIKDVSLSVKGVDDQQYKKVTGVACYNNVLKGIRNLIDLGVAPTVQVTIVSETIPTIERLLTNLLREGVTGMSFDMATPVIVGDSLTQKGIPDPQQLAKSCVDIYRFLKDKNSEFNIRVSIPLCLFLAEIKEELIKDNVIMTCCHIQEGTGLIFDQTGNILPCNHFPLHPLGKFGVDFTDKSSFEQFWKSAELREFRKLTRRYPSTLCMDCPDWDICGGGCFIEWMQFDPQQFIKRKGR